VAGKIEKNQKMPSNRRLIGSTRQQKTSSSQFAQQKGVFAIAFDTAGLDGVVFDLKKSCLNPLRAGVKLRRNILQGIMKAVRIRLRWAMIEKRDKQAPQST